MARSRSNRSSARARRAPTSYAEPATTDDDDDFPDEDEDYREQEDVRTVIDAPPRRVHTSRNNAIPRARASKRQRPVSYAEPDSGSDSDASHAIHEPPSKKRKQSMPTSSRRPASRAVTKTQVIVNVTGASGGSGVIPQWQSLPYHILVQIFGYLSYPVYNHRTFEPSPSCRQLLDIARLCRAFAEPAFTVLYSSPPLVPMEKAHKLVDLLNADPVPMAFAYRQKVESLRIDVGQVATYSLPGYGHLDLHKLVKNLPRLVDLEFFHQKDMAPYRGLDDTIKWTYPDSLFQALEDHNPEVCPANGKADPSRADKSNVTHLRSWRWSSRLAGKDRSVEKLREIHLSAPFVSLQKLSFVNYQIPNVWKDEEDPDHEERLAESLAVLPKLEHLIFESSTLVNAKLLPLLPTNLRNLELINCWEVVAEDLEKFILTHGHQLRCLTLDHNQSLSLSWLPSLGAACPNLQVLRMDLSYFNLHATYHDAQPQYDRLLLPGQIPTWPSTLQSLEITEARKWEAEAAEMFFQSLVENAANLPDLRNLVIHGGLMNLSWRDRATFRDNWEKTLGRVFRREIEPCKMHSTLTHGFTKGQGDAHHDGANEITDDGGNAALLMRRSNPSHQKTNSNVRENSILPSSFTETSQGTSLAERAPQKSENKEPQQEPSPPSRRSTRQSSRSVQTGKYTEDSSDDEPEDEQMLPSTSVSSREASLRRRLAREAEMLRYSAGHVYAHHDELPSSPPSTPPNPSDSEDELSWGKVSGKAKGKQKEFIHGLCEVVDIKVDNQRPTEWQVTEADFLDSEPEGDDDWNGDDIDTATGYAW